jgi:hypothetical protein
MVQGFFLRIFQLVSGTRICVNNFTIKIFHWLLNWVYISLYFHSNNLRQSISLSQKQSLQQLVNKNFQLACPSINMTIQPPAINTYHCLCTSLLLASTHTLSSLPRRSTSTGSLDTAIILPLPSSPPTFSDSEQQDLPAEGYTITLGMVKASKTTVIRREDGFEKRFLWRCARCNVVVGYEMAGQDRMEVDGGKGKEGYEGKVMYVLPGGITSTDVIETGRKIGEGDVDVKLGTVAAFE